MYKKITEGDTLTITGLNLYPDSTQVFFNTTGNEVGTLSGSFNSSFTQVSVVVPCCLPELNDVIVYNGINYATGDSKYRFFGKPSFSGISDDSLRWGESALISGAYLHQTTGVFVEDVKAVYYKESENSVVFTMPSDISVGSGRDVTVKTKGGEFTTQVSVEAPPIEGDLNNISTTSGLKFGESGFIQGKSLHKVNRVVVTGFSQELVLEGGDLIYSGSSGLSFNVPTAALNGYPVKLQNQSGFYANGSYVQTIDEEIVTASNLKVISPYISSLSSGAGKFEDSLTVNGSQVETSKILFSGYNQTHVEATTTATGLNSNTVSVPRGIMRSQLIASGYTGDTDGTYTSTQFFYPIPTITGLSTTNFVIGGQVTIDAVNAAEARALVGIDGNDKIRGAGTSNIAGRYFVSTPTAYNVNGAREYGSASLNNSSLSDSLTTGITKVTATINANMVGAGTPFLVSIYEGGALNSIQNFGSQVINIPNYNSVSVSGEPASILGLSSARATKTDQITISGNNLMNAYRLSLSDGSETKAITSGSFVNPSGALHPFVSFTNSGNDNYNHQTHSINVNLSDFSFVGSGGSFTFLTPSP